jgi:hypothetical protein
MAFLTRHFVEKGIYHMTNATVIDFTKPIDFSPDPLTDVLRAGARGLLATAVRAKVSEFGVAGQILTRLKVLRSHSNPSIYLVPRKNNFIHCFEKFYL